MMRRLFLPTVALMGVALALSGCANLAYYPQAAAGQWELWRVRRPVAAVLADATTPPALRQRLAIAQDLRAFASAELALPESASYQSYADLQRPYVVKNVLAAPELSLELRQWCFWLIGCLSYRGYFDAEAAQELVDVLRSGGDDVYVADIPAYSTLGWFADPLLNTFIHWPTGRLAELLFHELAHQRLYVVGDSAFNEAFATAVGQLGAQRWLEWRGTARERAQFAAEQQRRQAFLQLTAAAREELAAVYASSRPVAEKRMAKQRAFQTLRDRYQALRRQWDGYGGYDDWFARDLNNAKLAGISTYYQWVPAFTALFARAGEDFAVFYRAVELIGQAPPEQRQALLSQLSPHSDPSMLARDVPTWAENP
ncbi:MAG: aminopeptidase [Candidatus Contendobacter sp.]